jgi:hypothetical protein
MLYYCSQIWCSDNTDAIVRMKIQYGTSFAYPARTIGAHVSTVPNHITGNTTRLRTRGFIAMCGTFGYELDFSTASKKDLIAFQNQIDLYRLISPIIRWGDLYRLWNPFKVTLIIIIYHHHHISSSSYIIIIHHHTINDMIGSTVNYCVWLSLSWCWIPIGQSRGLDVRYSRQEPSCGMWAVSSSLKLSMYVCMYACIYVWWFDYAITHTHD